ncbi:MAG: hypothetical protein ACI85I_000034 [Arenicella sp.]|jgi:hypothetical protein
MEENYHDNEFEKHFRKKMEGFEDVPPKMAWENISEQIPPVKKNKWKRFAWLFLLIPVCCVPVFLQLDSADSETDKADSEKTELVGDRVNPSKISDKEVNSIVEKFDTKIVEEIGMNEAILQNEESISKAEKISLNPIHRNKINVILGNEKNYNARHFKKMRPRQRLKTLPKVGVKAVQRLAGPTDSASDSLLSGTIEKDLKNEKLKIKGDKNPEKEINSVLYDSAEDIIEKSGVLSKTTIITNHTIEKQSEINLQSIFPNTDLIDSVGSILPQIVGIQKIQSKEESKPKKKWTFFVETATLYTSERIAPNKEDEWILEGNESADLTTENLGFSVGFGVSKNIYERVKLDASLNYSLLRKQLNFNYQSARPTSLSTILDSVGIVEVTPNFQKNEVSASIRYQLLSSNVGIRYQVFAEKPNQFLKFGGGLNWLFHLKTRPKGMVILEEKNWIHPSTYLGYEWNRPFGEKMTLGISPTINYYFSSLLTEKSSISAKPYSLGLNLRLSF